MPPEAEDDSPTPRSKARAPARAPRARAKPAAAAPSEPPAGSPPEGGPADGQASGQAAGPAATGASPAAQAAAAPKPARKPAPRRSAGSEAATFAREGAGLIATLNRLDLPSIRGHLARDARGVDSYATLAALARRTGSSRGKLPLLALALAVQGTQAQPLEHAPEDRVSIARIREVASAAEAAELVTRLRSAPINRSWTTTSRVMHLLNPRWFAVWDAGIARAFGLSTRGQFDRTETYLAWLDWVHGTALPALVPALEKIIAVQVPAAGAGETPTEPVSATRALEQGLSWRGRRGTLLRPDARAALVEARSWAR